MWIGPGPGPGPGPKAGGPLKCPQGISKARGPTSKARGATLSYQGHFKILRPPPNPGPDLNYLVHLQKNLEHPVLDQANSLFPTEGIPGLKHHQRPLPILEGGVVVQRHLTHQKLPGKLNGGPLLASPDPTAKKACSSPPALGIPAPGIPQPPGTPGRHSCTGNSCIGHSCSRHSRALGIPAAGIPALGHSPAGILHWGIPALGSPALGILNWVSCIGHSHIGNSWNCIGLPGVTSLTLFSLGRRIFLNLSHIF